MIRSFLPLTALACFALGACSTAPRSSEGRTDIRMEAGRALAKAERHDPSLSSALHSSAGYAVFPDIGKAAVGVGGAYGKGVLYERERVVGYCDNKQASIGLQLGGQTYTEIICFEDAAALEKFKDGDFALDAQTSAVAIESGVGANARYSNGVKVFTTDESGMMIEASVGGQKFTYEPL
jgi:lipid-binding SYLF domain-containing protein